MIFVDVGRDVLGDKADLTEICDEDRLRLITHAVTTWDPITTCVVRPSAGRAGRIARGPTGPAS